MDGKASRGIEGNSRRARALWWDKAPRSLDAMQDSAAAKVPNKAYYYDAN
jgi:hypothetical protein